MFSIVRDPRRLAYTICTARAPEEVFTGRYSDEELETLERLLSRLPTTGRDDDLRACSPQ